MKKKPLAILCSLITAVTLPNAAAQDTEESERLDEVLIIGSRMMGRSAENLPVPVDMLTAEDLRDTGQVELGRMLQISAPSFNFSSSTVSDGTDALRPATLRGLGPDQTLVLINGKRRHQASLIHINTSVGRGTAGTDMNAIPVAAIQRVDILRDGAAAQYGSDAIAGIINIVLKDSDEDGQVDISSGQTSEGDGTTTVLNMNKGFDLGGSGFFNISASYRDRERTNRADPQGVCLYGGCVDTDNNGYLEPSAEYADLEINGPARDGFRIGDADSRQFAVVINSALELGEGELYGFITYSRRENESGAFYRNPMDTNGVDTALLTDGLNPADSNGFLPLIYSEIDDVSYNFGYQIELRNDASIDLSYTKGVNHIDYHTRNSANYSYANFMQYGLGLTDDQIRQTIPREAYAYGLELSLQTINLDFTQRYNNWSLALGTELRTDEYKIIEGDPYAYFDYDTDPATGDARYSQDTGGGIQGFNGIAPESALEEQRSVISFYIDSEYDISDRWMLSAALRYDDYDGFGDTINYKLASRFALTDDFSLRTSASTGFRAPSMQQLYFNNVSTQIRDAGAVTVGTFRNDSPVVRALGVPELKEEESQNFSIGFVANLTSNWNLTIDAYAINIDDRIAISNQLDAGDDPGAGLLTGALAASAVESAQFFLNGADTETKGVDLVSTYYGIELGDGALDLTLAANFTETEVTDTFVPVGSAFSGADPATIFSAQDISIIEEWQPKDRLVLSGKYSLGAWSANLALNRYGEYTVLDSSSQTYGAELLTDINVRYAFNNGFAVTLTGSNIFDVTPDEATNTDSRGGLFESSPGAQDMASDTVFRYSRRSAPFGFNGAFFAVAASYQF